MLVGDHRAARKHARETRFDYFRNRINTSVAAVVINPLLSFEHSAIHTVKCLSDRFIASVMRHLI